MTYGTAFRFSDLFRPFQRLFVLASMVPSTNLAAQEVISDPIPAHFERLVSGFPNECLAKGPKVRSVALTFDDGPSNVTREVLEILKKHNAKATFFWQGQNLTKYPELVRRAIADGHELANHSWNHTNSDQLNNQQLWEEQIFPTLQYFDSLYGYKVQFFRPPYGSISAQQVKFLGEKGVRTVLWSLSTLDWDPDRNSMHEIATRFKRNLHPGAIVLLHDEDFEGTYQNMLQGLEEIIAYGQSKNYEFVTLPKLLKQSNK